MIEAGTALGLGAAGTAAALVGRRVRRTGPVRFALMAGTSIAAPSAAGWVTDFLNAAYYARSPEERHVDDLRLAFAILTTRWYRGGGRRLRAFDVLPLHRAFGRDRFLDATRSRRGTLDRAQLLDGAARLHGAWFPGAYADAARRGWGIAFETEAERAAYSPGLRLHQAALGPLAPPAAPHRRQVWHTYAPVAVPSAPRLLAALARPETWPDYASELGRFTPLRAGGLAGQTFEIEVVARVTARTPIITRGYVSATRVETRANAAALDGYVAGVNSALIEYGHGESTALPAGATPLLGLDLTTHAGHFLGRAVSKIVVFEQGGRAYLREVGVWDPMEWYVDAAYQQMGRKAQRAFWGMESPEKSMLHQMSLVSAA